MYLKSVTNVVRQDRLTNIKYTSLTIRMYVIYLYAVTECKKMLLNDKVLSNLNILTYKFTKTD